MILQLFRDENPDHRRKDINWVINLLNFFFFVGGGDSRIVGPACSDKKSDLYRDLGSK